MGELALVGRNQRFEFPNKLRTSDGALIMKATNVEARNKTTVWKVAEAHPTDPDIFYVGFIEVSKFRVKEFSGSLSTFEIMVPHSFTSCGRETENHFVGVVGSGKFVVMEKDMKTLVNLCPSGIVPATEVQAPYYCNVDPYSKIGTQENSQYLIDFERGLPMDMANPVGNANRFFLPPEKCSSWPTATNTSRFTARSFPFLFLALSTLGACGSRTCPSQNGQ